MVDCHCGKAVERKIRWAAFTVHFDEPRAGRSKLGILSMHLNNERAKKREAAPADIASAIDEACELGEIDIVCGDINQARWQSADHEWHEGTLDALESRQYMPIADYGGDSCFIALHRSMVEARPRFAAQFLWNRPFLPVSCLCPETVLEPILTSVLKHYSALGIGRSINIQCHVSVRRRSWSRDCHLC